MTSPPQCPMLANQRFNTNSIVGSTPGARMGPQESLYRFFPFTSERVEGDSTIERLHSSIARKCSPSRLSSLPAVCPSSSLHGHRGVNGMGDKHQKVIKNIYGNVDVYVPPRGPTRGPTQGSSQQQPQQGEEAIGREGCELTQLLFLVRHGETDMNAAGRLQGRSVNAPLNATGRRQADELGLFLRNVPFGTVTVSSLSRSHEVRL